MAEIDIEIRPALWHNEDTGMDEPVWEFVAGTRREIYERKTSIENTKLESHYTSGGYIVLPVVTIDEEKEGSLGKPKKDDRGKMERILRIF